MKNKFFEDGYSIVKFPENLAFNMFSYAQKHLREVWSDYFERMDSGSASLEDVIFSIPDAEWSEKMSRAFRIFPIEISHELYRWADAFVCKNLKIKRTAVGVVYTQEHRINPKLTENSSAIYYRCVRPGKPDAGRAHRDADFWEVEFGDGYDPKIPFEFDHHKCIKFWIPLSGCTRETSIQIIPKSHKMEIPTTVLQTEYGRRPAIKDEWVKHHEKDFIAPVEKGSCLVFHMGLVHRGPINLNNKLRISSEITLAIQ